MNVENNNQPTGSLKISQDVLATIANFASEEIDGVVSLANTYAPIKSLLKRGSIAADSDQPQRRCCCYRYQCQPEIWREYSTGGGGAAEDGQGRSPEHDRHHRLQGKRACCGHRFPADRACNR